MTELDHRLKALSVTQSPMPIPKGPLPKGIKVPKTQGVGLTLAVDRFGAGARPR